jgi:pyrroline-5-carboxylate reductase
LQRTWRGRCGDKNYANTPLLIGKGVTAISKNEFVSDEAFTEIFEMFSAIGSAFELPEDKMNAVIAATSSAPAYIYYIIDCIYKEAVAQGLDSDILLKMVCETVKGSADMVINSNKDPSELVKMVTSPKGTTEKAMEVFYEAGLSEIISRAMKACTKRAEELSETL